MPRWDETAPVSGATGPGSAGDLRTIHLAAVRAALPAVPFLGLAGGIAAASAAALSPHAVVYTGVLGFIVGVMVRDAVERSDIPWTHR